MTVNFGVNYLAIIVAAIAAVAIGILYYGVLGVGDRQSRMLGATPARAGPVQGATGLIVGLVNAWVIALLSLNLGAASVADAILLGALVWLGFGATFKAAQVAFERRPWAVWVMQAIHDLTAEVVVADEPPGRRTRRGTRGFNATATEVHGDYFSVFISPGQTVGAGVKDTGNPAHQGELGPDRIAPTPVGTSCQATGSPDPNGGLSQPLTNGNISIHPQSQL